MVAAARDRTLARPTYSLHPVHAALLAGTMPLFLGALLSDWAYATSYEIQWKNFASWLIVGGLVFGGFTLLFALVGWIRAGRRGRRPMLYFLVLLAAWVLGFINALVHAKDAWASMPDGLILSAITALLVIAAMALGFPRWRTGAVR